MGAYRQLSKSDGMRRPVSGRDAVGSQVIDVLFLEPPVIFALDPQDTMATPCRVIKSHY